MNLQISVVIATYRRPELLHRCLQALSAQCFAREAYEIVVVSDGPDEPTAQLIDEWNGDESSQVRYYATPYKKGPAAARNYGWLNAKSKLIAFTDDDCIPGENWLAAFCGKHRIDPLAAFSGKTVVPVPAEPTDYEQNIANLQTADFITANCCCTKQALQTAGGFDEQFTMAWREDSDLEFKLMKAGVVINKADEAIVVHPVRKVKWGVSIKDQKKTMFNALLYKKDPGLYRQKIQPLPPVLYYLIIIAFLLMVAGFALATDILSATGFILWLIFSAVFIFKRLRTTTRAINHMAEMIVTSLIIPFLSIYWQFYGAVKYRVLFI